MNFQGRWPLDHVGHVVPSLEPAIETYTKHFGLILLHRERAEEHHVDVAFLGPASDSSTGMIELLAPLPGNLPLQRFLERRGPGLHHICFAVQHLDDLLRDLERSGLKLIDHQSRSGSRGSRVAFVHPASASGALIELCEHPGTGDSTELSPETA